MTDVEREIVEELRLVKQRTARDCSVAALAMVTGFQYEEVIAAFPEINFDSGGLTIHGVDWFLVEHGFAIARKREWRGVIPVDEPRSVWPCEPFGSRHLCEVRVSENSPVSHFVVMDHQGQVLDPLHDSPTRLTDYYEVWNIAAVRSLYTTSPQLADAEQPVEERESMKRLREVAGDRVADACKRGIDEAMELIRADEQADEKDRRIYYQNIVYEVCELLDAVYTTSTCCGIVTAPTTQVQDRVRSLIKYRDQQSEKYQAQLAALTERLREAEEIGEEWLKDVSAMINDASIGLSAFTAPRCYINDFESTFGRHAAYRAKHEKGEG